MNEILFLYPQWNFDWFIRINSDASGPFLDVILPLLRNKYFWIPLYVYIASFLLINHGKKGFLALAFCGAAFAMSNTLSAELMKPMFKKDRPCQNESFQEHVILRVNCGPGKSFPSAHATNHMALAVFLGMLFWRGSKISFWLLILWALSIGYAQVYVGVHYPVDVLVGFALGALCGFSAALPFNRWIGLR